MTRRLYVGVAVSVVVCALIACNSDEHDDDDFRFDVIECEDALARIQHCCPDFDPAPVLCNWEFDKTSGCGSGTTTTAINPAFTTQESRCIRDTSCDDLVAHQVCARAQVARADYRSSNTGGPLDKNGYPTSTSVTHALVCP